MKTLIMLKDTLVYWINFAAFEKGEKMTQKTLEMDSEDTVYVVMAQVEHMTGVAPAMLRLTWNGKSLSHDTAGTLAENNLVPTYPDPVLVEYSDDAAKPWNYQLRRNTLRSLGFCVDNDEFGHPSVLLQLAGPAGQRKMLVSVTDYIRMDGGARKLALAVEAGDTVASLMEQVQRRRRYPVAMQRLLVSDADDPYKDRLMWELDATLADYNVKQDSLIKLYTSHAFAIRADRKERGKVFEEAEASEQQRPARRVDGKEKKKMQIFVMGALPGKTKTLAVDPDDTVYSIMAQIEDVIGVPPILQKFQFNGKSFYYDTPGTLADHKMVDQSSLYLDTDCGRGWHMIQRNTLRGLGIAVDDEDVKDRPPVARRRPLCYDETMVIIVTDYIRMDGGERDMWMVVEPGRETVAGLMERVQRRRRYPVAMQRLMVRDADRPNRDRRMDRLDATLADYDVKRGSPIKLYMDMDFAWEKRKASRAKEIADPGEQQKLDDDETETDDEE